MRFRIVTLLAVVAFISAWLATFVLSSGLGIAVRQPLKLVVFAVPIIGLIQCRGRQRAFFCRATVVIALIALPKQYASLTPQLDSWLNMEVTMELLPENLEEEEQLRIYYSLNATMELIFIVGLSVVGGLISVAMYDGSRKQNSG